MMQAGDYGSAITGGSSAGLTSVIRSGFSGVFFLFLGYNVDDKQRKLTVRPPESILST